MAVSKEQATKAMVVAAEQVVMAVVRATGHEFCQKPFDSSSMPLIRLARSHARRASAHVQSKAAASPQWGARPEDVTSPRGEEIALRRALGPLALMFGEDYRLTAAG
ncbi:hypothetical protein FQA47_017431 [Oryzias melastigma]|uniref:Uncharacterized protein n=1 Tax=Oryzias melastigma TaxID=30732 RepID=A0A834BTF2_ORYME|nr:hypothetical protein FQA47_017431 [Oryzias melastigma]